MPLDARRRSIAAAPKRRKWRGRESLGVDDTVFRLHPGANIPESDAAFISRHRDDGTESGAVDSGKVSYFPAKWGRWRTRNSMPLFFAAERKPIPFPRTEFNESASNLLRQREDVHGVAAAGRVRLRSQAYTEGSDRAATSRDGDVLASVDRIRHGPADDL